MEELIKKHRAYLISEIQFWENQEPFKPFYYKVDRVMATIPNLDRKTVEKAFRDYQHFTEI